MNIANKVKEVLSQVLDISPDTISNDFTRDSIDNWDSITQLTLVIALEEEFGVQFDDENMAQLLNFKSIILVLEGYGIQ